MYPDLEEAHRQYSALRELVILRPGGWADEETLRRAKALCHAARHTVDDPSCRTILAEVDSLLAALYSKDGHLKWQHTRTSGRDFLRLSILRELNAFDARLLELEEIRLQRPREDYRGPRLRGDDG